MTETTTLATRQPSDDAIAQYLGLDMRDARTHAVLAVCQRYQLDPLLKHVIVIPKSGVYITRDGLLHVAHRSGQLDGIVLEEQGQDPQSKEHWAVVSVYRKDMRHPFRYRGRYPANGTNRAYQPEMAVKCAEAMALRRAFDVTALPALEEMHQQPDWGSARVVDTGRLRDHTPPQRDPDPEPDYDIEADSDVLDDEPQLPMQG